MRRLLAATVAVLLLVPLSGNAQKAPTIDFARALAIAQSNSSGMTLLFGRSEQKGPSRTTIWGFYFMLANRTILEREVSGTSGVIVEEKIIEAIEDGPKNKIDPAVILAAKSKTLSKSPAYRFLEIAADKGRGEPTQYQVIGGDPLKVQVSGASWSVIMDMNTGQVLSAK